MSQTWHTLREAAELLGCSTRTVRRRIDAGELQTRLASSGQREVLIDPMTASRDTDTPDTSRADTALTLVTATGAMDLHRQRADELLSDVHRVRRFGYLAWSVAAALTVGIGVSVWWATWLRADADLSSARAQDLSDHLADVRADLSLKRDELSQAMSRLDTERERADRLTDRAAQSDQERLRLADALVDTQDQLDALRAERSRPAPWWQVWATIADRTAHGSADERTEVGGNDHEGVTP